MRWGILTNGRLWRLYEHERSRAGGIYFEVDLEELLRHNQPQTLEHFKYFYLFFRRQAFIAAAGRPPFVEQVFQGSVTYAASVGDRLKESVYDALRFLMNGFLAHTANRLDRNNSEAVREVHQNCLIALVSRLLPANAAPRGERARRDVPGKGRKRYMN